MPKDEDDEIIDPVADELDPETLQAVEQLIKGYQDASPPGPSEELSDYRTGRRDALAAVLATLSRWLDEIESDSPRRSKD